MGFFFSSNKDKLSRRELRKSLADQSSLGASDKEALRRQLKQRGAGAVSKNDILKATRALKNDRDDGVSKTEVEIMRRRLTKH